MGYGPTLKRLMTKEYLMGKDVLNSSCAQERLTRKGTEMFKKVIRWTPIISIVVIVAMYLGMKGYQLSPKAWTANPAGFGPRDIMSQIGHYDVKHLLHNAASFAFFFVPIELMLGKKKAAAMLIGMVTTYTLVEEVLVSSAGVGASGWIYSLGGWLLLATAVKAESMKDVEQRVGAMFLPGILFMITLLMANEERKLLKVNDGVGHKEHLFGAGIGIAVVLVTVIIFLPRWARHAMKTNKRQIAWH